MVSGSDFPLTIGALRAPSSSQHHRGRSIRRHSRLGRQQDRHAGAGGHRNRRVAGASWPQRVIFEMISAVDHRFDHSFDHSWPSKLYGDWLKNVKHDALKSLKTYNQLSKLVELQLSPVLRSETTYAHFLLAAVLRCWVWGKPDYAKPSRPSGPGTWNSSGGWVKHDPKKLGLTPFKTIKFDQRTSSKTWVFFPPVELKRIVNKLV